MGRPSELAVGGLAMLHHVALGAGHGADAFANALQVGGLDAAPRPVMKHWLQNAWAWQDHPQRLNMHSSPLPNANHRRPQAFQGHVMYRLGSRRTNRWGPLSGDWPLNLSGLFVLTGRGRSTPPHWNTPSPHRSLLTLVVANRTYVEAARGGSLERRYLEVEYAHTASATCQRPAGFNSNSWSSTSNSSASPGGGDDGQGLPAAALPPAAAAVDPRVVSSAAGAAPGLPAWQPGAAAVASAASGAALAAQLAGMSHEEWEAHGCEVWVSWALYDVKWRLQVGGARGRGAGGLGAALAAARFACAVDAVAAGKRLAAFDSHRHPAQHPPKTPCHARRR